MTFPRSRWLRDFTSRYSGSRVCNGESGATIYRMIGADETLFMNGGRGEVAGAVAAEAARLESLQGRLPVPGIRMFEPEEDGAWLFTEALRGRSGDGRLAHDPELLPRIVDAFAGFMLRIHPLDAADCPFRADVEVGLADARRHVAAGLVDEDDFDPDHEGWSAAEVLAEAERLAPAARTAAVTHGDFSLGNLILDDDLRVSGCIDVGRLGIADPYQDIAIFWQNLAEHGAATQQRILDAIGVSEPDGDRLRLHRCLDELF